MPFIRGSVEHQLRIKTIICLNDSRKFDDGKLRTIANCNCAALGDNNGSAAALSAVIASRNCAITAARSNRAVVIDSGLIVPEGDFPHDIRRRHRRTSSGSVDLRKSSPVPNGGGIDHAS